MPSTKSCPGSSPHFQNKTRHKCERKGHFRAGAVCKGKQSTNTVSATNKEEAEVKTITAKFCSMGVCQVQQKGRYKGVPWSRQPTGCTAR